MEDTSQKKEWSSRDVQRLRNIYNKNFGAATVSQVGYVAKVTERKEGEIWTDNNKQWIIKNGIKMTHSKIQSIRNQLTPPMLCPSCNHKMKDNLDKQMYTIHKKCFSCVQEYESSLKLAGLYDTYVKEMMTANASTYLKDARDFVQELGDMGSHYTSATGQKENWVGGNSDLLVEQLNENLDILQKKIENNDIH